MEKNNTESAPVERSEITKATVNDTAAIAKVQHDTWIATYPNEEQGVTENYIRQRVSNSQTPERKDFWKESLSRKDTGIWVAKFKGKVIGFCVMKKTSTYNSLEAIYVLPENQGGGFGPELIEAALSWGDKDKDTRVEVASYNEQAINFYKKYGFVLSEETGQSGNIPTVIMVKKA
jgi:ribosomal protein S18 acetylase RimI-like enzyme